MPQDNPIAAKKEGLCYVCKIWMIGTLTCIINFVSDGAKGFVGKKISMPQFMKKDEGIIMKAVLAGSKI